MSKYFKTAHHSTLCTWMFVALFIKALNWAQPKCPQTCERMHERRYIHTIEYDSETKKERPLIHATVRMNLSSIMLSKGSQTQKTTNCAIPSVWNSRKAKAMVIAGQSWLGAGMQQWSTARGQRELSGWRDGRILKLGWVGSCTY